MRNLVLAIATGAGTGYAPIAPGTAGSALAAGVWWVAVAWLGLTQAGWAVAVVVVTAVGIWSAGEAEKIFERHDDGRITVDEWAGQGVALLFVPVLPGQELWLALSAFLLFRLFDIWKPPPARRCEAFPGGLGVVADDLVAGLYASLCVQLLWRVVPLWTS